MNPRRAPSRRPTGTARVFAMTSRILGALLLALAVLVGLPTTASAADEDGAAAPAYTLLQMNLCLSGYAGCYARTQHPRVVEETVARIEANDVDAATLNEACSGDVDTIAARTGMQARFSVVIYRGAPLECRTPAGRGVFGNALLSRDPILAVEDGAWSRFSGVEERRWTCATTAAGLDVCTSHLSADGSAPTSANSTQCAELRQLLATRGRPVVFAGDVNRRSSCAPPGQWTLTDAEAVQAPGIQHAYGDLARPRLELERATYTDHDAMVVRMERPVAAEEPVLPVGPADLPQTATVRTLQPGVTHTRIVRGRVDPATSWVVEVNIPPGPGSPDPTAGPRAVQDEAAAQTHAERLGAAGHPATAQPVEQVATADVAAGVLGHRVRLDATYATQQAAEASVAELAAKGFSARAWYTGWDGGSAHGGRWSVDVLRIDPEEFTGEIAGTHGPTIAARETVTELASMADAPVAVNAGYFAFSPANGAPGDPAGAGVYDGRVLSEAVADRPVLALRPDASNTAVLRPRWRGRVQVRDRSVALDGLNRVPGLIRNCGGDPSDLPTRRPVHDVTCTDPAEVVAFTQEFDATTPSGPGRELVIARGGRLIGVRASRGTTLERGQVSVQVTGDAAPWLTRLSPGTRVGVRSILAGTADADAVLNGGPELVRDGSVHVTQDRDGFRHAANPSFDYGFVLQRNPRTFAGIDGQGRTVLVTVDGRQLGEMGLSLPEAADVARVLGLVQAVNLDGGGSTAMVVDGNLVTQPSDTTGERAVGDAVVVR